MIPRLQFFCICHIHGKVLTKIDVGFWIDGINLILIHFNPQNISRSCSFFYFVRSLWEAYDRDSIWMWQLSLENQDSRVSKLEIWLMKLQIKFMIKLCTSNALATPWIVLAYYFIWCTRNVNWWYAYPPHDCPLYYAYLWSTTGGSFVIRFSQ